MPVSRPKLFVYNGRDNVEKLQLKLDGATTGITQAVTSIHIVIGNSTVQSTGKATGPIQWTDDGLVTFALGAASLTAGIYASCRLLVFDPTNTNGIVWAECDVEVKD